MALVLSLAFNAVSNLAYLAVSLLAYFVEFFLAIREVRKKRALRLKSTAFEERPGGLEGY
jgi:hypothetical protein